MPSVIRHSKMPLCEESYKTFEGGCGDKQKQTLPIAFPRDLTSGLQIGLASGITTNLANGISSNLNKTAAGLSHTLTNNLSASRINSDLNPNQPGMSSPFGRRKGRPKRLCCRSSPPYNIRDSSVFHSLLQLRGVFEKKCLSSPGEPRQALSLVNRFPLHYQSGLTKLAQLLSGYSNATRPFSVQGSKPNHLRECSECHTVTLCSLLFGFEEQQNNIDVEKYTPTFLHVACLLPNPAPLVDRLLSLGEPINLPNLLGQTPLHALLLGDVRSSCVEEALETLLMGGSSVFCRDFAGETPLLYVRNLLRDDLYPRAVHIAAILLKAGADVNQANKEGRTLLSYSVQELDRSLELTKLLLNHGANIWGDDAKGEANPFTWLLKAVMSRREVQSCDKTLRLMCAMMCEEPPRMRHLVARAMIRHSRSYEVFGPLFLNLKALMEEYWLQPQSLTSLSRLSVRRALCPPERPCNLGATTSKLCLPPSVQSYLLFSDKTSLSLPQT